MTTLTAPPPTDASTRRPRRAPPAPWPSRPASSGPASSCCCMFGFTSRRPLTSLVVRGARRRPRPELARRACRTGSGVVRAAPGGVVSAVVAARGACARRARRAPTARLVGLHRAAAELVAHGRLRRRARRAMALPQQLHRSRAPRRCSHRRPPGPRGNSTTSVSPSTSTSVVDEQLRRSGSAAS